jgi:hypothetical protein
MSIYEFIDTINSLLNELKKDLIRQIAFKGNIKKDMSYIDIVLKLSGNRIVLSLSPMSINNDNEIDINKSLIRLKINQLLDNIKIDLMNRLAIMKNNNIITMKHYIWFIDELIDNKLFIVLDNK